MIYVTHDQVEAMTLASRIVVLAGGGISQVGAPLDLYERPENEFVAQFIGSPAMNLMPGQVVETGAETVIRLDAGGTARSSIPTMAADMGMKVKLGVRPEDLLETDGDPLFTGEVEFTEALGRGDAALFQASGRRGTGRGEVAGHPSRTAPDGGQAGGGPEEDPPVPRRPVVAPSLKGPAGPTGPGQPPAPAGRCARAWKMKPRKFSNTCAARIAVDPE